MKIVYFIYALLRFFTNDANALDRYDQPYDEIIKPNIIYNEAMVSIKIVSDADAECREYGGNFNYVMRHCTVQWNNPRRCLLIMDEDAISTGSLGHEIRHCFEGDWHDRNPNDSKIRRR